MLYNKKHEDGDIVVLKLVTGEEVIAKLVEGNMEHIKISKPMMIVHTPKGLAMSQYIMMQDINDAIVIDVNKVIAVTSANKVASSQYQETLSSIKVPTQAEFVNNIPLHRQSDSWSVHCCGVCHGSTLAAGSGTVYADFLQVGRIGDPVACGSSVATGSGNVFAGG